MAYSIFKIALASEHDVVAARRYAREIAAGLGFDSQDQTRIATAVSEIARNACSYARGGSVELSIEGDQAPQLLLVSITDHGGGIPHLKEVLEGRYQSATGMGMGIVGARRLMDQCDIRSTRAGTQVLLKKLLPPKSPALGAQHIAALVRSVANRAPVTPFEEIQQQNRELLRALADLRQRQEELAQLNRELEDTNRGVVALYAELDEKAGHLRRADEMKSRFLSNMSHEFRTPLNSIRALATLLISRSDGPLTAEQEKQVQFVHKSAQDLTELVNDLLDIAKIEAGKIDVHPVEFSVVNLFSTLRGMLRPLLVGNAVNLRFDEPAQFPPLYTDEAKVSQILRNFISNALKFTERGEVCVAAAYDRDGKLATFTVTDTGIGIRAEDQERIFEEFSQVDGPLQVRVKGTGLGLPLCKKLAGLLGGEIALQSTPGAGSTFSFSIPMKLAPPSAQPPSAVAEAAADAPPVPILVVEDDEATQLFYEHTLRGSCYRMIAARSLSEARRTVQHTRPAAVILDIVLRGEDSWGWLGEFKANPETQSIPVLVVAAFSDEAKARALGATACLDKPVDQAALLANLDQLTARRILLIDDDETMRYAIRKIFDKSAYCLIEATSGRGGLAAATAARPSLIVLDLDLPDLKGEEVLARLRVESATAGVPVLVITSRELAARERIGLLERAQAVLEKHALNDELWNAVVIAQQRAMPGGRGEEIRSRA